MISGKMTKSNIIGYVPVHVLRKIAGHGSLTTTQRYLHPDTGSLTAAGDALSSHLAVKRSPNGPQLRVV